MYTEEVAARLVEMWRRGDFDTAQKEWSAKEAVSIEPHAASAFEKETKRPKAIPEKGKQWRDRISEYAA